MGIECIICQNEAVPRKNEVFCTPCGHIFHKDCILEFLTTSRLCPRCKKPCHVNQLFQLYTNLNDDDEDDERSNLKLQNEMLVHRINQLTRQMKIKDVKFVQLFKMVGQITDSMRCFENNNLDLKEENDMLEASIKNMRRGCFDENNDDDDGPSTSFCLSPLSSS